MSLKVVSLKVVSSVTLCGNSLGGAWGRLFGICLEDKALEQFGNDLIG